MQKQKQYHSKGSALIVMCVASVDGGLRELGCEFDSTRLNPKSPSHFTCTRRHHKLTYLLEESW